MAIHSIQFVSLDPHLKFKLDSLFLLIYHYYLLNKVTEEFHDAFKEIPTNDSSHNETVVHIDSSQIENVQEPIMLAC